MSVTDPMVTLPLKRPENLDWCKPMKNFIKQTISQQEADSLAENFDHMNRLRKGVQDCANDRDKPTESLVDQVIVPYVGLLQYANLHFPLTDGRIKVTFQWHDICKRKKAILPNVNLEVAGCLFNAAVVYQYLAANEDRGSSEGIKNSFKHFQMAAGYLELVKERVSVLTERLTTDLSVDGLNMFSNFMLTCAHHCAYLKAATEMKDKRMILSKLAMEGAFMYEDLRRQMAHPSLSESVDRLWLSFAEFYQHVFTARGWIHVAADFHHKDEIGKEIGHLQMANQSLNSAATLARQFRVGGYPQFVAALQEEVRKTLAAAVHDNERVYHDRVPAPDTLSPPDRLGRTTAKATALGSIQELTKDQRDPFHHITPVHILDAQLSFKDQIGSMVTQQSSDIRKHRDKMRDTINQMGVFGAMAAFEKGATGLPDPIWQRIQKIKQGKAAGHGGTAAYLTDMQATLKNLAENVRNTNSTLLQQLDDEQRNDDQLRGKFGAKWNREESSKLNNDLRTTLNDFRNKINAAQSGDKIIEAKLQQHLEDIMKLDLPKEELDKMLPGTGTDMDDGAASGVVAQLKEALKQLEEKENVEQVMLGELREKFETGDKQLAIDLAAAGKDGQEGVLANIKKEYEEKIQHIIANQIESDNILNTIITLVTQLNEIRSQNASQNRREIVINQLDNACNKYLEIVDNMDEGSNFYRTTLDVTDRHKGKVEDFIFARTVQKDDLLNTIQREAAHIETTNELIANIKQLEAEQASIQEQVKQQQYQPPPANTSPQATQQYQQPPPQQQYQQPPPQQQQYQPPPQQQPPQQQYQQPQQQYQPPPNQNQPPPQGQGFQNQFQQPPPQQQYQQPQQQYQQPPQAQSQFQQPQPGQYQQPQYGQAPPQQQQYAPPQQQYAPPQQQYQQPPQQQYGQQPQYQQPQYQQPQQGQTWQNQQTATAPQYSYQQPPPNVNPGYQPPPQ
eukprot:TRINITY_DN67269_c9_g4_i1.p1 TRINITY_DN67269_c9_g4~~TRINITY_DN67269_c9_g4_i1.p1  ORF type:complete len:959 (+),score=249.84 TRINITY_DN67269_c9_g4_i1:56-2932(+)